MNGMHFHGRYDGVLKNQQRPMGNLSPPGWHEVATADDIEIADAKSVQIGGQCIAVFNVNGSFYATSGLCTHARAQLADGYIDGETVECPLHQGLFHIPTGKALSAPVTVDLRTFPVRIQSGKVEVLLDAASTGPA